jgi:hypothetical protein
LVLGFEWVLIQFFPQISKLDELVLISKSIVLAQHCALVGKINELTEIHNSSRGGAMHLSPFHSNRVIMGAV